MRICCEQLVIGWNFDSIAYHFHDQFGGGRSRANDGGMGFVEFSSVGQ